MKVISLNKLILIYSIFIISILSTGCSVGNGREVKSKLDYLDGRNWEKSQVTLGNAQIPTRMKRIDTIIEGGVYNNGMVPLKFTIVYLIKDNNIITETSTDHLGNFKIQGYIPNGRYIIKVDSKPYNWEKEINVDKYEIKGLELNIK
jgi:hypothetical protein